MTLDRQLIFAAFVGAIGMACVNFAVDDMRAWADQHERETCKDKGDMRAMMARLPAESHNVEVCTYFMRYGSKDWVPEMGNILPPEKMKLPTGRGE